MITLAAMVFGDDERDGAFSASMTRVTEPKISKSISRVLAQSTQASAGHLRLGAG